MEIKDEISDKKTFDFPEEILLEILIKLPAKSIFRFRCVSKNWISLISDPSFFPRYVSQSNDSTPFTLIFQCCNSNRKHVFVSNESTFKKSTSLYDQIRTLKVEATSKDLILYRSNSHGSVYVLANPFTRQCISLPMHSTRRSFSSTGLISNVRNGITSYNIVRITKYRDNIKSSDEQHCLNLEIFSSEKGEWKNFKAAKNCTFNVEFDARPCIVVKGVLHWICNRMTALLAYDPCSKNQDLCRFISTPNGAYNMNGKNAILGVSGEKFFYFEMRGISIQDYEFPAWRLWVMKDYERGEWSLERESREKKIDSFGVLCNVLTTHSPLFPMVFHPWNRDIVYFWFEGFILTFSISTGRFEDNFSTSCMFSAWEIFPLLMSFCPSKILEPQLGFCQV